MNYFIRFIRGSWVALLFFLIVFSSVFALNDSEKTIKPTDERNSRAATLNKTSPEMRAITALTAQLLAKLHYEGRVLDESMSSAIFDQYIKAVDNPKILFTAGDIREFEKERKKLGQALIKGNCDFPFAVFKKMLERLKEYEAFATEYLKKNPTLDSNETFSIDRTKAEWPANETELRELWRKKLTNDLIVLEMTEKGIDDLAKNAPDPNDAGDKAPAKKDRPDERVLKRISQLRHFYETMEPMDVLEIYLSSVAQVYDPHSAYMSPRTGKDFDISMSLSLVGIGAVLTSEDGYVKVVEIVPGGPADKDGQLKAEDRIIAVAQDAADAVDVIDMPLSKVVDMIRGKEGSKVILTVLDGQKGLQALPKKISIVRAKVEMKDSSAKGEIREIVAEDGRKLKIGVVSLPSFYLDYDAMRRGAKDYKSSSRDVKDLLENFKKQGIDGVVVDLRNNGGGALPEAINLTGLFIASGPVVQVKDTQNISVQEDQDGGAVVYDGPLLVLVNRFSASASEIFAAAIRDYRRGLIVGDTKTHGKGTVQTVHELDRYMTYFFSKNFPAGILKLTNAKFYRINGESTQLRGVSSDLVIPSFTEIMDTGEDQLDHALPWDTIKAAEYEELPSAKQLEGLLPALKRNSAARMEKSEDFRLLHADMADLKKLKNKKILSLNLDLRMKEFEAERKLVEEQRKLSGMNDKNKKVDHDIFLNETLNIMADLLSLSK